MNDKDKERERLVRCGPDIGFERDLYEGQQKQYSLSKSIN